MVEKSIELSAVSANGIEDAVQLAVARAAVTINNIREAQVTDIVGLVEDDGVKKWKVAVRISFVVEDRLHE